MSNATRVAGFHVAPFSREGELLGVGEYTRDDLAPQWLASARRLLATNGAEFRTTLPAPLERLSVRFSTAQGAALATFHAGGHLVASAAYLRGLHLDAEAELLERFVTALRGDAIAANQASEPFQAVFDLTQRPLYIVVPWSPVGVSEPDQDLVQQVATHLAAAFFGQ